jgi:hypothetical protein
LTAITSSGGKNWGSPGAIALLKSFEAFLEEALAPLADDLSPSVQAVGDLVVTETPSSEEHHAGPKDLSIRQRIFPGSSLKDTSLLWSQNDLEWRRSWHTQTILRAWR